MATQFFQMAAQNPKKVMPIIGQNILDPKNKDEAPVSQPSAPPTQGAMEAFISSRINSAGGRTMKAGGKAGFLFPSGPFKGMTLEQATESARQEWSNMDPGGRDTWASKNVTGNRTTAELSGAGNSSASPFALDAPKFNSGQKVGRDGKAWGLGEQSAPTTSVPRGGNSTPSTPSEEAMLPKPTFAVARNTAGGPPAPGQVATSIDGQYGTGSVTTGLPKPTARTGRLFDNGKDVTGQVMNSIASRQPAGAVANNTPGTSPVIPPSKYPSPVDAASDAAMKTLVKPLMTPKAAPAPVPNQTQPLASQPPNPVRQATLSPHVINVGSAPGAQSPTMQAAEQFRQGLQPPVTASSVIGNVANTAARRFVEGNKQALGVVGDITGRALNTAGNIALAPVGAGKVMVGAVQKAGELAGEVMNKPLTPVYDPLKDGPKAVSLPKPSRFATR